MNEMLDAFRYQIFFTQAGSLRHLRQENPGEADVTTRIPQHRQSVRLTIMHFV